MSSAICLSLKFCRLVMGKLFTKQQNSRLVHMKGTAEDKINVTGKLQFIFRKHRKKC